MRIRATAAIAAVSGALALTGAVIPAAQAAGTLPAHQGWLIARQAQAAHPAVTPFAAGTADSGQPYTLGVTFSDVKVDYGRAAVAVGTTNVAHVPYSFTLTATNVDVSARDFFTGIDLYRGSPSAPTADLYGDQPASCAVTSSTSSSNEVVEVENCTGTVDIYPKSDLTNADAGAGWHTVAWAVAYNGQDPTAPQDLSKIGVADRTGLAAPAVQRYSTLSAKASATSVTKGRTITITGSLTRANWDTHRYAGFTGMPVKLQFRKKGSSTYTTLKTVTTDSHGNVKTTWKASADGYWRYSFAGSATTPAASATGVYVHVK